MLWLVASGPLGLAGVGILRSGQWEQRPHTVARLARLAASLSLSMAIMAAIAVVFHQPVQTQLIGFHGVGFALYLDALSAVMFVLVSFIGLIVIVYSRNYLDGDPGQSRFLRWLCAALGAVLFLIISGNLLQFSVAWVFTSLSLHKLLVFYRERPAAVLAARKKFLVSRIGDICLIVAMALLFRACGSLDYAVLFDWARSLHAGGNAPSVIHAVSILLVIAALLKSAQFPLHGWLIEVMETPTPVSALLHAGIINAGGFLVLRLADIISLSPQSLELLAIVGGLTALFGSLVMLTQTSIKVSLAYSTIGQMGFMMLECGLGAFSAALLHIVGHSLYKAHAFLTSGSVVDISRASWTPSPGGQPHPARLAIAATLMIALMLAVSATYGATLLEKPGVFALGAIVLLGLTHLVANAIDERPNIYVIGRALALAFLVAVSYFALQLAVERLLEGSLPSTLALRGPLDLVIVGAILLAFGAATIFQSLFPVMAGKPRWQALHIHLANGLYVNTVANRLILRFWPTATPKLIPPSHDITSDAGGLK